MSATQDLIAAALTLCDVSATDYEGAYRAKRDLREACARAMVQPVGEVPMPDTCGELSDRRKIFDETAVRIYGQQCWAAGYAAGVAAHSEKSWGLGYTSGYNDGVQDGIRTAALRGEVKP